MPGLEQYLHVFPAFGVLRARDIGVGKLVDDADLGAATQDGLDVRLPEHRSSVLDLAPRNDLQALGLDDGVLAPVRLEITHNDVHTLVLQLMGFVQHLISLADARSVTQEDLKCASTGGLGHVRYPMLGTLERRCSRLPG